MTRSSFAWDLQRNLTIKCSLFCTKFILKNLFLIKNSLYKKPLFLKETARVPASPLKPLGQCSSNFIWSLLRLGEQKIACLNGRGPLTKMAAMLIYVKNFKNLLLQNSGCLGAESLHKSSGTRGLPKLLK